MRWNGGTLCRNRNEALCYELFLRLVGFRPGGREAFPLARYEPTGIVRRALFPSVGVRSSFSVASDLEVKPLGKSRSSLPERKIREPCPSAKMSQPPRKMRYGIQGSARATPRTRYRQARNVFYLCKAYDQTLKIHSWVLLYGHIHHKFDYLRCLSVRGMARALP